MVIFISVSNRLSQYYNNMLEMRDVRVLFLTAVKASCKRRKHC